MMHVVNQLEVGRVHAYLAKFAKAWITFPQDQQVFGDLYAVRFPERQG